MKLTPKIQNAINRSASLHLGQKRKADGLPYISHPYSVAIILSEYTEDERIIEASLLHDVLEDVRGYSEDDLRREFGDHVAKIVKEISEDKDPNDAPEKSRSSWQERKEKYLKALADDSFEAMMISCADKIHNLQSLLSAYNVYGEKVWEHFNSPQDKKLWFYSEVYKILKTRLDNPIVLELEKTLQRAKKILNEED